MKAANRLDSRLYTVRHQIKDINGNVSGEHVFEIQVGWDADRPVEVAVVWRGRIGEGLDLMFQDFGVWISRALQKRDPMTGEESVQ